MQKVTIWHNPRCTKSRETLALLQSRHIDPEIIEYLKTPPEPEAIDQALVLLRMQSREFMRVSENDYQLHNLADPRLTRSQLIDAMHTYPILIQRPVVFANGQARIGRPPSAVLEIL